MTAAMTGVRLRPIIHSAIRRLKAPFQGKPSNLTERNYTAIEIAEHIFDAYPDLPTTRITLTATLKDSDCKIDILTDTPDPDSPGVVVVSPKNTATTNRGLATVDLDQYETFTAADLAALIAEAHADATNTATTTVRGD